VKPYTEGEIQSFSRSLEDGIEPQRGGIDPYDLSRWLVTVDRLSARVAKLEAALLERTVRMAMADEYLRRQKGVHSVWSDTSRMTTEEWDRRDPEVKALSEMERYGFCAHDCLDLDSKTVVGSEAWNREMEVARAALEDPK